MGKTNNPTGIGGFKPGQSGNPSGVSKNGLGNRPYRAALRIEAAIHEHGGRLPKVRAGSLRDLARQALLRARHNTAALEHIPNRLDGPVIPSPDDPPSQQIVEIRVVMVDANEPQVINRTTAENLFDEKAIEDAMTNNSVGSSTFALASTERAFEPAFAALKQSAGGREGAEQL